MSVPSPELRERYGTERRSRRPLVVLLAAVLAAAGLGWLVWAIAAQSSPLVQSQLVAYSVRGEHAVQAEFTVARSGEQVRASCLLRAYAADHAVVGELALRVGPGPDTTTTLTESVRTERRATNVDLIGCTADGQRQRR